MIPFEIFLFKQCVVLLAFRVIPTLSPLKESEGEASGKDNDDPCRLVQCRD